MLVAVNELGILKVFITCALPFVRAASGLVAWLQAFESDLAQLHLETCLEPGYALHHC